MQLLTRHWKVRKPRSQFYRKWRGHSGEKPVLQPGETHLLLQLLLVLSCWVDEGDFMMINFSTTEKFEVAVPPIQLRLLSY